MKREAEIERRESNIEEKENVLNQEIAKQKKTVSVKLAEEKYKLQSEIKKQLAQHDREFEERKGKLETEFKKQKDGNNKRMADLENERDKLLEHATQSKEVMKLQGTKLEEAVEQCDVLKRAKDSVKSENKLLEMGLESIKQEFALTSKSKEHLCVVLPHDPSFILHADKIQQAKVRRNTSPDQGNLLALFQRLGRMGNLRSIFFTVLADFMSGPCKSTRRASFSRRYFCVSPNR